MTDTSYFKMVTVHYKARNAAAGQQYGGMMKMWPNLHSCDQIGVQ
jgi:hypothetical protein